MGLTAETGEATAGVGVDGSGVRWEDGSDHGTTAGGDGAHDTRRQHARLRLRVTPRRVRAGEPTRFRFRAMWIVRDFERRPGSGVAIRFRGRRVTTDGAGLAAVLARVRRPGTARAIALHEGRRAARASVRVVAAGRR